MTLCVFATSNDLYMPGENHRCEHIGRFPIGGELGQYLKNGLVCKNHLKFLLRNREYVDQMLKVLREANAPKGQDIHSLQDYRRKQAIWSELS